MTDNDKKVIRIGKKRLVVRSRLSSKPEPEPEPEPEPNVSEDEYVLQTMLTCLGNKRSLVCHIRCSGCDMQAIR